MPVIHCRPQDHQSSTTNVVRVIVARKLPCIENRRGSTGAQYSLLPTPIALLSCHIVLSDTLVQYSSWLTGCLSNATVD